MLLLLFPLLLLLLLLQLLLLRRRRQRWLLLWRLLRLTVYRYVAAASASFACLATKVPPNGTLPALPVAPVLT